MMQAESLPYSAASDRNKEVILEVLQGWIKGANTVLEVGTGTAQHAAYFAAALPDVTWQCADQDSYHKGIHGRIRQSGLSNLMAPLSLEVTTFDWAGTAPVDVVFTANTMHIMSWQAAIAMIVGVARVLREGGLFILYGPFNVDGQFTSEGNARFHGSLQQQNPHSGIRHREDVIDQAHQNGLELVEIRPMPANNQILIFKLLPDSEENTKIAL